MAVLAQSVGAVLAATWVHDYAPPIRALVLASPAFKVKLYVPFARTGLKLMRRLLGNFFVNSYVKARFLTHDPVRRESYDTDPLIARAISVDILLALYDAAERVVADARAIVVPTQLLVSGADFVVHHGPQHRFFENLGAAIKERHVLAGFFHDTLGERDRAGAVEKARAFMGREGQFLDGALGFRHRGSGWVKGAFARPHCFASDAAASERPARMRLTIVTAVSAAMSQTSPARTAPVGSPRPIQVASAPKARARSLLPIGPS
jgi:hypothetical protein